jgi:hypothetical protein
MLLRKVTFTGNGECILRLPKLMVHCLGLKTDEVMIHRVKRYLVVEAATARLKVMAEGRTLDKLRPLVVRKAT